MDAVIASTETTALRYRVGGMDCPSCAGKIETALRRLGGTDGVRLNYHNQTLALRLDEVATSREALEARIRSLGYEVTGLENSALGAQVTALATNNAAAAPTGGRLAWLRGTKVQLCVAIGCLLVLGFLIRLAVPAFQGWAMLPAALLGLWFAGRRAIALARAGSPFSIEMLMSIATLGALLIGATAEAAMVVFLFTVGELMEGIAAGRARAGIQSLSALVPRTAMLVEGESVRQVQASDVLIGQVVLIRPGERVPVDGTIFEGASELDESPVTGESIPVARKEGEAVLAGSVNGGVALQVSATRAAADNTIARIVHMVEEAQSTRAPTQRFIERFSMIYTPTVVGAAVLTAVLAPLAFGAAWSVWLYRGLALLLIGCPCALVLSTPAAITSALAAGARRGLLVKGGAALETIGRVRAIAFDKTGTLTRGRPEVTDIIALSGTERTVLALAASVETGSSHPIARAILERAARDTVPLRPTGNARAIAGQAATATIFGKLIAVGSPRYAAAHAPLDGAILDRVVSMEGEGKTVVMVVSDGQPLGLLALRDAPREDAAAGLEKLKALGVRPIMLTGDNRRAAGAIGLSLGLEVQSELLPGDKLREIAALKERGPVAMVGDGINDAPALAAASVGIAMGGGTDVALETADAALLGERVTDVAALVRLSRTTMHNIHQNVAIALGLKAVFLVTTLAGITGLWPAILADTGATVIVTLNALRLLRH